MAVAIIHLHKSQLFRLKQRNSNGDTHVFGVRQSREISGKTVIYLIMGERWPNQGQPWVICGPAHTAIILPLLTFFRNLNVQSKPSIYIMYNLKCRDLLAASSVGLRTNSSASSIMQFRGSTPLPGRQLDQGFHHSEVGKMIEQQHGSHYQSGAS